MGSRKRLPLAAAAVITATLLSACEPERGVRATRDFDRKVDVACVERALNDSFPHVSRYDYVDDGYGTFTKGTQVAQFTYYRSDDRRGVSWVEVGDTKQGARLSHSFTGLGMELPQEDFPEALSKMRQANAALAAQCQLELGTAKLKEIGQDVDALND